jgi:hypothetical protein
MSISGVGWRGTFAVHEFNEGLGEVSGEGVRGEWALVEGSDWEDAAGRDGEEQAVGAGQFIAGDELAGLVDAEGGGEGADDSGGDAVEGWGGVGRGAEDVGGEPEEVGTGGFEGVAMGVEEEGVIGAGEIGVGAGEDVEEAGTVFGVGERIVGRDVERGGDEVACGLGMGRERGGMPGEEDVGRAGVARGIAAWTRAAGEGESDGTVKGLIGGEEIREGAGEGGIVVWRLDAGEKGAGVETGEVIGPAEGESVADGDGFEEGIAEEQAAIGEWEEGLVGGDETTIEPGEEWRRVHGREGLGLKAKALRRPEALASVSASSASGMESATMPAPAWNQA